MAIPIWPLSLPQTPLLSGYKETVPSNLIRSDTDTGPAKVRRRGHSKPYTAEASYLLTSEQMGMLVDFFEITLAGGAKCFEWPRPRFSTKKYVRVRVKPSGDGLFDYSVSSESPDLWNVKITLELFVDVPVSM